MMQIIDILALALELKDFLRMNSAFINYVLALHDKNDQCQHFEKWVDRSTYLKGYVYCTCTVHSIHTTLHIHLQSTVSIINALQRMSTLQYWLPISRCTTSSNDYRWYSLIYTCCYAKIQICTVRMFLCAVGGEGVNRILS